MKQCLSLCGSVCVSTVCLSRVEMFVRYTCVSVLWHACVCVCVCVYTPMSSPRVCTVCVRLPMRACVLQHQQSPVIVIVPLLLGAQLPVDSLWSPQSPHIFIFFLFGVHRNVANERQMGNERKLFSVKEVASLAASAAIEDSIRPHPLGLHSD